MPKHQFNLVICMKDLCFPWDENSPTCQDKAFVMPNYVPLERKREFVTAP